MLVTLPIFQQVLGMQAIVCQKRRMQLVQQYFAATKPSTIKTLNLGSVICTYLNSQGEKKWRGIIVVTKATNAAGSLNYHPFYTYAVFHTKTRVHMKEQQRVSGKM